MFCFPIFLTNVRTFEEGICRSMQNMRCFLNVWIVVVPWMLSLQRGRLLFRRELSLHIFFFFQSTSMRTAQKQDNIRTSVEEVVKWNGSFQKFVYKSLRIVFAILEAMEKSTMISSYSVAFVYSIHCLIFGFSSQLLYLRRVSSVPNVVSNAYRFDDNQKDSRMMKHEIMCLHWIYYKRLC